MSFPLDAEVEDTSLRDSLRAFLGNKKRCTKEKGTDTFPSENGKQYKYPRPLMHLRLSIYFYSDESKALESCQKRKTSCGSLQGSDSCRISISIRGSYESLMNISQKSHRAAFDLFSEVVEKFYVI